MEDTKDDQPPLALTGLLAAFLKSCSTIEECDAFIYALRQRRVELRTGIGIGSIVRFQGLPKSVRRRLTGRNARKRESDVFIVDELRHMRVLYGRRRRRDGQWEKVKHYIGNVDCMELCG